MSEVSMFQRLSISQRIITLTTAGFLLAAGILVAYIYLVLPASVGQLLIDEQQTKAERIVNLIQAELDERQQTLEKLAPRLLDGEALRTTDQINRVLDGLVMDTMAFNGGIAVFDRQGIGIGEYPPDSGRIGLDIADRDHVHQARTTQRAVITEPLVSRSLGLPSFFINVPILSDDGEVLGFVVGVTVLQADNFLIDVAGDHLSQPGEVYIIDPDNLLIATSSQTHLAMQPLPQPGRFLVFDQVLDGQASGISTDMAGQSVLFASAAVPQMGWIAIQTIPRELIYQPVTRLVAQLLVIAVIICLMLAIIFSGLIARLLRPLGETAATLDAMVDSKDSFTPLPEGSHQDEIGQLVKAFNRLLSSRDEQRQRLFLATSGVGVGIWDYEVGHRKLIWDDIMHVLYDVRLGEYDDLMQAWQERVHHDDLPWVNQRLQESMEGERPFDVEFRVVLTDGTVRWIKANATVVRDEQNQPLRIIGTNWDISERKRVELMKNQFVSTVSHELRTPLTSISGSLGLIAGGATGELNPQAKQLVDIAYKNSQRLGHLINDLLDMEKIAAGKMRFDMVLQPLMPIVEQSLEANEAYAQKHDVSYRLLSRDDAMLVRVDAQRLIQVLSNLLSNAAKFSPAGETVNVNICAQRDLVRVEVHDCGPGISPEFQSKLFTKFSQADSSDTRQKGGTGLGLAITKELVERMGGAIGVESEVGNGSVFFFELPAVHKEDLCDMPEASSAEPDGSKARILVIEDDPDVARLLATILKQDGYLTDIAYNGAQAIALVEKFTYDAVTLDLQLPDRNGVSIIRQLRTHSTTAHTPIVVVAGNVQEGQLALNGGFNAIDWLQKPISQELLQDSLHRVMGHTSHKPLVLHIEDDEDTRRIISLVAQEIATFHPASTKQQARLLLEQNNYDVVILDIGLPDGSGWDLLPTIKQQTRTPQVIVLSGQELNREQIAQVDKALQKTPTSTHALVDLLKAYNKRRKM
ncbi:response regulator [Desulfurispira natronophila]|uniref:histidine kinase n=1 Tax=Desulfurispira natronophila TaxID=682562 RepID=A0A7W8DHJ1_9BACT|nr:response regulator [Desulfurispira natronophila]MBB5022499.1 signal transduction histidine kinase/DNA-binding response OmpR family regulator/HAMP domain-containing protein [Desulfurispira natronophila]